MSSEFEHPSENCLVRPRYRRVASKHQLLPPYAVAAPTRCLTSCVICGSQPRRLNAKFCAVCGHNLRQDYAPLDLLKASYNLRKQINNQTGSPPKQLRQLFAEESNGAASTAMAFMVYSLVPYLGILFCPGTLILGGIGLAISFRKPQLGGRQTAVFSLLLGSVVLASQTLLWWLLYIIPELKR